MRDRWQQFSRATYFLRSKEIWTVTRRVGPFTKSKNLPGMELSNKNAIALLLDLNQDIEEYAEATVKNIIEDKDFDLTYPPNSGLTESEKAELTKLHNNEQLKNALRKIIADNTAGVIFNMLNLLDGTGSPKLHYDNWTGVKLIDEDLGADREVFGDTLHDCFYETYWEWRKLRPEKTWKLDTYDNKKLLPTLHLCHWGLRISPISICNSNHLQ